MACGSCGRGVVQPVDVEEPNDAGHFSETWECNSCGAKGYVNGKEEQCPSEWDRFGSAFETDIGRAL